MRLWFSAMSYDRSGEASDHGSVGPAAVEWDNRVDAFDEAIAAVLPDLSEACIVKLEVTIGA